MELKSESALKQYWLAYGGWPALFSSKYLWFSVCITLFCFDYWLNHSSEYITLSLSILPSLLGFALGGYAVWLAIGDQKLKKLLSDLSEDQSDDEPSDFMSVNATFVHFIILQIIALIYILFLKTNSFSKVIIFIKEYYIFYDCLNLFLNFLSILASGIGFFLFIYSISSMLAATFAVFKIARWSDILNRMQ